MKSKKFFFISAVAVGCICISAWGREDTLRSGEKYTLINQPHPALAGIDKICVFVLRYGEKKEKDMPFWEQLEADIHEKLQQAGIESETNTANNISNIPELRIYVSTLHLKDSRQHIFSVRTALARSVCLRNKQQPVFKADIWQASPAILAVTAENSFAEITDIVLEQVDSFIQIYDATNSNGLQISDEINSESDSLINPETKVEKASNPATTDYLYVASKSSVIFHKPDCRWAKNISDENLVTYKNKDEAIKAGKRPCKTCNP